MSCSLLWAQHPPGTEQMPVFQLNTDASGYSLALSAAEDSLFQWRGKLTLGAQFTAT